MLNREETSTRFCRLKKEFTGWTASVKMTGGAVVDQIGITTLDAASAFLMKNGVEDSEIDVAIKEMFKNDHNYAEFGIHGSFIFSSFVGHLN